MTYSNATIVQHIFLVKRLSRNLRLELKHGRRIMAYLTKIRWTKSRGYPMRNMRYGISFFGGVYAASLALAVW